MSCEKNIRYGIIDDTSMICPEMKLFVLQMVNLLMNILWRKSYSIFNILFECRTLDDRRMLRYISDLPADWL